MNYSKNNTPEYSATQEKSAKISASRAAKLLNEKPEISLQKQAQITTARRASIGDAAVIARGGALYS